MMLNTPKLVTQSFDFEDKIENRYLRLSLKLSTIMRVILI